MSAHHDDKPSNPHRYLLVLTLGALGVVYGDIGTSPLYALRECFRGSHSVPETHDNVLGILSLIIWSLIFIVAVKYVVLVMRADNRGEGGTLSLLALLRRNSGLLVSPYHRLTLWCAIAGAAMLYGDGAITPAISVLSAVEGLAVATPVFEPWIVPLTVLILCFVFASQSRGSAKLGMIFGPVILTWFITLGTLGVRGILMEPSVVQAISPHYAFEFFYLNGWRATEVLGAVFLAVTGAEALYVDMGHFGRRPIRLGWFAVVFPGLLLNYLGQGALLLSHPGEIQNPFFELAPSWGLYPLVLLATVATVIASQALISGAFSMTSQAIQLGLLPRLQIFYTSSHTMGQIYIPTVNYILFVTTIVLVLMFQSSSNLASAYGIGVALVMVNTTFLVFLCQIFVWRWSLKKALLVSSVFFAIDAAYVYSNMLKLFHGGWVPLAIAGVLYVIMTTWLRGREILAERLAESSISLKDFFTDLETGQFARVPGTAIFMARDIRQVPAALLQNTRHNHVVHERVLLLQVMTEELPYVSDAERVRTEHIWDGFHRVYVRYGYMEKPHIPRALMLAEIDGLPVDSARATYFLGREIVLATHRPGMALWRERLFAILTQVALRATAFFRIPPERVIEIGMQVEL